MTARLLGYEFLRVHPDLSALGQFLKVLQATPPWVNTLMTIRNRVVAALGLKNLGTLSRLDPAKPASAYLPGDQVGIFTLIAKTVFKDAGRTP